MAKLARGSFMLSSVIGLATTALIYQLLPILPDQSGLIARYLTGHPLEFAIAALAMVASVNLAMRSIGASSRKRQLAEVEDWIDHDSDIDEWKKVAKVTVDEAIRRRLKAFADLRERGAKHVMEHAQRISDRAADDLADAYAPLTTILWAIPIVGFLGTVMGITIAVANISPDQLESSLGNVTGGLAVAFDTTALALGLSLVLGFATLFVRRREERLLARLDDFSDSVLIPSISEQTTDFDASSAISNATAQLLALQMQRWNDAMDEQRTAFAQSLQSGHQHFVEAWADMQATAIEQQSLNWEASADQMGDAMADWQARFETTLERISTAIPQIAAAAHQSAVKQMDESMREIRQHSTSTAERLSIVSETLATRTESTESLIARCEQLATDVASATAEQNRDWNSIATKTAALTELQEAINSQISKAGVAEQLDETLHQLTAAVHMLTSRARAA